MVTWEFNIIYLSLLGFQMFFLFRICLGFAFCCCCCSIPNVSLLFPPWLLTPGRLFWLDLLLAFFFSVNHVWHYKYLCSQLQNMNLRVLFLGKKSCSIFFENIVIEYFPLNTLFLTPSSFNFHSIMLQKGTVQWNEQTQLFKDRIKIWYS